MSEPVGDHLDDEQLTALLDGAGTDADRAHLATCDRCTERSEAVQTVAALVAAPPTPPSATVRDAAVAAALAAADRPVAVPRPARRRPPAWLLPAAAVVALVALVAAIVPRWGTGDDDDAGRGSSDMAARSSGDDSGTQDDAAESSEAPAAGTQTLRRGALGDLGAVDDEAALAARIDDAQPSRFTRDANEDANDPGACDSIVRRDDPDVGTLVFRASASWRGTSAEVLGYAPAGTADATRAVVVAVDGCATLADVDLP